MVFVVKVGYNNVFVYKVCFINCILEEYWCNFVSDILMYIYSLFFKKDIIKVYIELIFLIVK